MKPNPRRLAVACGIVLAAGCQTVEPQAVRRPSARKDACAERLHDVCEHLLLYYSTHRKLPPTLDQFKSAAGPTLPPLVCPASGRPYVYDAEGVAIPGRPGRVVLYDPEASHSGMRWGILVGAPSAGVNMTARVILLADDELVSPAE